MKNQRIYSDVVDINSDSVQAFYDGRAEAATKSSNPYSSVLLSDHSPELIDEQMAIENKALFPKLNINAQSKVLDIGCGIGRWAEKVIPVCDTYYGIDFSQKMIDSANERAPGFGGTKPNYKFEQMSFQDLVAKTPETKYNCVIISGILVYISDNDVRESIKKLTAFLDDKCTIFVWEPCGVGRRLTLKDFYSEALKDEYSVIYRTKEEYNEFFEPFTSNGFNVSFCEYYSALGGTVSYSDTDKIYYILER
jgi:2-polyprenyl-3-methyl-5-hydroxy-6-metoxy-1,4-benzoquinol methylase